MKLEWKVTLVGAGSPTLTVDLSGDTGNTWSATKANTATNTNENTVALGTATDNWSYDWEPAGVPSLDQVRSRVEQAWRQEQGERAYAEFMRRLRSTYGLDDARRSRAASVGAIFG